MMGDTLRLGLGLAFLAGALAAIVLPTATLWLEVEACTESGGRWIEHDHACERSPAPRDKPALKALAK